MRSLSGKGAYRELGEQQQLREDCTMNSGKHANALKSKNHVSETIVDWDEFRKIVQVGDTYEALGLKRTVSEKVFEMSESGEGFTIHVFVK
ncbi:hypothetical protein EJJ20_09055 [Pseudomonas poae]|nr:hypothetical protein EJJ20_09055 [Pseudomonas poae]